MHFEWVNDTKLLCTCSSYPVPLSPGVLSCLLHDQPLGRTAGQETSRRVDSQQMLRCVFQGVWAGPLGLLATSQQQTIYKSFRIFCQRTWSWALGSALSGLVLGRSLHFIFWSAWQNSCDVPHLNTCSSRQCCLPYLSVSHWSCQTLDSLHCPWEPGPPSRGSMASLPAGYPDPAQAQASVSRPKARPGSF